MFVLDVKMPVQLLQSLVEVLQDQSTILTLEGDLSQVNMRLLENTIVRDWPHSGSNRLAEIPLTKPNVKVLIESVLPRAGIRSRIYHIEIAQAVSGNLMFAAFDNFSQWKGTEGHYNRGAGLTAGINIAFLDDLIQKQIIRKYQVIDDPSESWD